MTIRETQVLQSLFFFLIFFAKIPDFPRTARTRVRIQARLIFCTGEIMKKTCDIYRHLRDILYFFGFSPQTKTERVKIFNVDVDVGFGPSQRASKWVFPRPGETKSGPISTQLVHTPP